MIVEDDAGVSFALSRLLGGSNARLVQVASVSEARERLVILRARGEAVHGLLTDKGLPDGAGDHVIDAYRRLFPTGVAAMMSGSRDADIENGSSSSAIRFFRKPFEKREILDWLKENITSRRAKEYRDRTGRVASVTEMAFAKE
jgi:DNA-binding NtrC family response regulator